MTEAIKEIFFLGVKIFISCLTLFLVSRALDWEGAANIISNINISWTLLALALFWVAQIASSKRCVYIAEALGGKLRLSISIRAHFVGLWFNQVLPSSLGGDVFKLGILSKPIGIGLAFRTCILERVSGLIFLLATLFLTAPLYFHLFPEHYIPTIVLLFSIILLGSIGVFVLASRYLRARFNESRFVKNFSQIFVDLWTLRCHPFIFQQAWTSAIVHLNGIVVYALLGMALGTPVNFLEFFLIVPLIFLAALLPFSFAGWGIREVGAVWLFGLVGFDKTDALAISITFGLFLIVAGLPGLIYLIFSQKSRS